MSVIDQRPTETIEAVTFNLYRDIHKGIRAELFGVTQAAGNIDPGDRSARAALADRVATLATILEGHAEGEDREVQPPTEMYLPDVAEVIARDHARFEGRVQDFTTLAAETVDATGAAQRTGMERLYMELASFTGAYLAHQNIEERVVMPALERALGVEGCFAIHAAIVSAIPPDQMAKGLAVMLPALNIDDLAEALGGMQHNAPAEVFAGVWGLAGSVLPAGRYAELGVRLGLT
jgi:Hemerythrin HHE cation binding domain